MSYFLSCFIKLLIFLCPFSSRDFSLLRRRFCTILLYSIPLYSPRSSSGHYNSLFIDFDGIEKSSVANTVQNLFPLLLHDLPSEHLNVILSHLKDEKKFNAKYMIPTVAMDDPQFSAEFPVNLMWRGPVWGFTNWFLMEGLGLHGEYDLQVRQLSLSG
jgi:hypothetical protein